VDAAEIARFSALAEEWWDPRGKFRPLHRINPVRLAYVREHAVVRFGRAAKAGLPLEGLRVLDIGCGGGLLAEPLARLGGRVTAIDASEPNIAVARAHAEEGALAIDYRAASAEALAAQGERFDIVLNMEVVEHVADVRSFLAASVALLAPGGMMVLATINRTPQSFALAIVAAEYLLGWLPRGTHDWRKFLRPSELAAHLRACGAELTELKGVRYSLLTERFALADDLSANYMALVVKG
jgi:2-polyprenyl-6-hydroxyphenyl methylase/3-demethylubiquinone-9 3-methyltransferase